MDRRRPEHGGGALVLHLHVRFSAHHGQPSRRIQEQVVGGPGLILVLPQGPPRPLIEEPPAGGERSWQPWGYYNHGGGREAIARSCHIDATRGVQGLRDSRHRRGVRGVLVLPGPRGLVRLFVGGRREVGGRHPYAELHHLFWH